MGSLNLNLGFALQENNKGYKYKDLAVPLKHTMNRDFDEINDLASIQNGINNIFTWRKGQRVLEPEFGSTLYQYIDEPINEKTAKMIGEDLKTLIEVWEPRVKIIKVIITPFAEENTYYIQVFYNVPSFSDQPLSFESALTKSA
jgi:phage baseplate assembly protein W